MTGLGDLLDAVLRGATAGLGTALFATALVVTYRSTGVLNLSLGGVGSVSAFVLSATWANAGWPMAVGLGLAVAAAVGLGLIGERVMRPVGEASVVVKATATLGILLVIQALIHVVWGAGDRFLPLLVGGGVRFASVRLGWQQVLAAVLALSATALIAAWTRRSPFGMATLAIAEDRHAARALGVRPERVSAAVWMVSAALAGVAGVVLSGLTVLNATEMTLALVAALAAAVIAGFERLWLAIGAAAAVGAAASVAASVPMIARQPGLVESLGFVAVLAVILFRPQTKASVWRA